MPTPGSSSSGRPRLAILADYVEEGWPSMDLAAEMLCRHVGDTGDLTGTLIRPRMTRAIERLPVVGRTRTAFNGDRLIGRFWQYPRVARQQREQFELFHVADHSYAHLVLELPYERTGVFCFDIDAFRCLNQPAPAAPWLRAMARRTLQGLRRARVVFYATNAVRSQILAHDLVEEARLVYAPLGVSDEFTAESPDRGSGSSIPGALDGRRYLLHVGTCIPRKRIDVLLNVFAALRAKVGDLRLVKVGGPFESQQLEQVRLLGLEPYVLQLTDLERPALASLYRNASLVLVPSEAEGFGFPVVEALACGAPVLASDLPVLREVGGAAAEYAEVGNVDEWADKAAWILEQPARPAIVAARVEQARKFRWQEHSRRIAAAYLELDQQPARRPGTRQAHAREKQ